MISNRTKVKALLAMATVATDHLSEDEQNIVIAQALGDALKEGLLAAPAELRGGKWHILLAADVRSVAVTFTAHDMGVLNVH